MKNISIPSHMICWPQVMASRFLSGFSAREMTVICHPGSTFSRISISLTSMFALFDQPSLSPWIFAALFCCRTLQKCVGSVLQEHNFIQIMDRSSWHLLHFRNATEALPWAAVFCWDLKIDIVIIIITPLPLTSLTLGRGKEGGIRLMQIAALLLLYREAVSIYTLDLWCFTYLHSIRHCLNI